MKYVIHRYILGLAIGFSAMLRAGTDVESIPGWTSDFHAATNRAIQANIPLVMIWGNRGCDHCQALEADVQSASFVTWREKSGYEFCFVLGTNGKDPRDAVGARTFAYTANGVSTTKPASYPLVCVYWKRADGSTVGQSFTTKTAESVMKKADLAFASFCLPDVISFPMADTALDRLEIEPDTPHLNVPIVRDIHQGLSTTNSLVTAWPDGIQPPVTNHVFWTDDVTQQCVRITLPYGAENFPVGKSLSLTLLDRTNAVVATSRVHCVEKQANSVLNPKFVGEPFDYGEWTMDYEAAKKKDGYVLANFSGVLWCPYCNKIENTLFASEKFRAWAKTNKVSLVLFDQGLASSPATAVGNGKARLLSYTAGACYYREGRPMTSGATYLSRKAITEADASARIEMTTHFTHEWLAPDSTAARLSNPTLLLVKDDKVKGRANLYSTESAYDVDENLFRLTELLKLADGVGEVDNYTNTTTRTIADGECEPLEFQINDRIKCFRLVDAKAGTWNFCVTNATSEMPVVISAMSGSTVLGSGTNALSVYVKGAQSAQGIFVKLITYSSGTVTYGITDSSTVFSADLVASRTTDSSVEAEGGLSFEQGDLTAIAWTGFNTYKSYPVLNRGSGTITLRKVSGKLPSGLSFKYDSQISAVVLSGVTKSRVGNYTAVYRITDSESGQKNDYDTASLTVTVANPSAVNGYIGVKRTKQTIPLLLSDDADGRILAGELSIVIGSQNTISASYVDVDKKKTTFQGRWMEFDSNSRSASAHIEKKGHQLDLTLSQNGILSAMLICADGIRLSGERGIPVEGCFSSYAGRYTVQLPCIQPSTNVLSSGDAALVLEMSSKSDIKKGRMKFSGTLPNGKRVSGSAYLEPYSEIGEDGLVQHATLPIFVPSSTESFGVFLKIVSNAAKTWETPSDSLNLPTVKAVDGTYAFWRTTKPIQQITFHDVYGAYFETGSSPVELCERFGLENEFTFNVCQSEAIDSERWGPVLRWPAFSCTASAKKFVINHGDGKPKLTYTAKSGILSGSGKVEFEGKSVNGTFEGVVLPGWIDCHCGEGFVERPFAAGAFWFTDYVRISGKWKSVRRSVPFEITATVGE